MLERTDIDALLIGALYGELTPAEEARLSAHLDSHPADKSTLADLTLARNAVRESRFLTVQIEPPQAVSALLLQEAARRAPRVAVEAPKKESWFQRFVLTFARHPAMAAAAMLVLVVGVAGIMYSRDRVQFAEQRNETAAAPAGAPATGMDPAVEEARQLQDRAGSAYAADLAEGEAAQSKTDEAKAEPAKAEKARSENTKNAVAAKPPTRTYFGVQSDRPPMPKELENAPARPADASLDGLADDDARLRKGRSPGSVTTTVEGRRDPVVATPSPPPPPAATARAPQATPSRGGMGAGGAVAGEDALKDKSERDHNEEATWAREQHVKVANAVKANNCKEATSLALALSNRAPAYYTSNVENDRELKKCMTYINAEREREAEQRAKAAQRRNSDEAADRPAPKRATPTTDSK